jgi:protein phosphatase
MAETIPIVADPEAADDEPTHASDMLLMSAAGQSHVGKRRKRNEDRYAIVDKQNLFVVADGMGGYAGGAIAAQLACDTIVNVFTSKAFEGSMSQVVPRRGAELALAIQQANKVVFERANAEPELKGMGTTVVCARFAPKKARVYLGHIGDSRCYRLRDGMLHQLTTDHTMESLGVTGKYARYLSRALGVGPGVRVDLIIAKPLVDDIYLMCSDGLTKMIRDDEVIRKVLVETPDLQRAVDRLVDMANEAGGKDNVTVLCVGVKDVQSLRAMAREA